MTENAQKRKSIQDGGPLICHSISISVKIPSIHTFSKLLTLQRWKSSTLPSLNLFLAHQLLSGSAQLPNLTSEDYGGLSGLLSESLVQRSPLSKICTYPEWAKGLAKSLWTPHIQHTPSLNCYSLVDATELWAPERHDTGTVSSLRQSISWTLDNNYGTHIIYTLIYLTHILSLHFNCT